MPRETIIHRIALIWYGLGFCLLFAYWVWAVYVHAVTPTISKVIVSGEHFKSPTVVAFPFFHNSLTHTGNYNFNVTLFYNEGEESRFLIVPNDCLRSVQVNGQPYTLPDGINYCDYINGFTLDFRGLLRTGSNNINFFVEDFGRLYGLNIVPSTPSMPSRIHTLAILAFGFGALLLAALIQFWRKINQELLILAACLLGSVLLRLPYFWSPAYVDEGAFMMLGRDFLHGNLPYLVTFENKPPLVNVIFSLFLFFADCLPGVRMMIALYLGITAYTIYRIGVVTNFPRAGMWSAIFSLFLFSTPHFSFDHSFQFAWTEQLISFPLALMFCYLLKLPAKRSGFLAMGLCCAFAALIRTNVIMVVPFVALILLFQWHKPKYIRIWQFFWFSIGVIAPYVLLICIYASVGHLKTLFDSMIVAPIVGFSDAGVVFDPSLISQYMDTYRSIISRGWDMWSIPIIGAVIGIPCISWQRHWRLLSVMIRILVVSIGILIATVILVYQYDHYMLQLVVPISLMAGFCVSVLLVNRLTAVPVAIAIIFSLSFLKDNLRDGIGTLNEWNEGKALQRDAAYKAGEFMRQQNAAGEPFFSYDWAELPFYTNAPLVTMHVYPPINTYEKLNTLLLRRPYNPDEQVEEILRQKPHFIAYRSNDQKYDLLVNSARNLGYHDIIDIDGIRLLERP